MRKCVGMISNAEQVLRQEDEEECPRMYNAVIEERYNE